MAVAGIRQVVLTHAHPDHAGSAAALRERLGVPLIVGAGDEIDLNEVESALGRAPRVDTGGLTIDFDLPLREAREQFERAYLEHQLRETGGSVGKVAQLSGVERTHLYRKLRALGINPKDLAEKS